MREFMLMEDRQFEDILLRCPRKSGSLEYNRPSTKVQTSVFFFLLFSFCFIWVSFVLLRWY